jgi:GT2 family glycosyltransferase
LFAEGVERLIIVDNGSPAADLDRLRAELPEAEILELGANTGFGPGANAGLRRWLDDGDGDWVILVPHDADPAPGCVGTLLAAASARPHAGLACAEYGEGELNALPTVNHIAGGIIGPTDKIPGWEACAYPHGTLMVLRRDCLEDIGLFDERYFAYCEETDLGMRATAAGWEVGIVWGAVVRNPGMWSQSGVPEYLMLRNSLHLVRWHFGRRNAATQFVIASWVTLRASLGGRQPYFWHRKGRTLALRDFLLGRVGPPPASLTR